ncbi:MAG: leucine-rich repeat domain-containing protein [Ruminococcus sp.]
MKKLSLFMAVIILSTLFSVPANAVYNVDTKIREINGVKFTYSVIDNKYVEIRHGEGFIPAEIEGYPVTMIGPYAYMMYLDEEYKDFGGSWVIPDTVTHIDNYAFKDNKNIYSIKIPASVTYIEEGAFYGCENLKKIELPPTIRTICKSTFQNCRKLKKATLGSEVRIIEDNAFFNCRNLAEINFNKYLNSLGTRAFYNCTSLKSLDFSKCICLDIVGKEALGYYDEKTIILGYYNYKKKITAKKVKDFTITATPNYYEGVKAYAFRNNFNFISNAESETNDLGNCSAGNTLKLKIDGKKLNDYSTKNNKIIKITKKGKIIALQKGKAKVKVTLSNGKKYSGIFTVKTNPKLIINGSTLSAKKTYTIKKGDSLNVKISGKAKAIKNKYVHNSIAKITSDTNDSFIKIKGLKIGTTTVKIKVNGVKKLTAKVKVS